LKKLLKVVAGLCAIALFGGFFWWRLATPDPKVEQSQRVIAALPPTKNTAPFLPATVKETDCKLINKRSTCNIRIPKIGLTFPIVEGTELSDLKNGVGHYLGTQRPGEEGNFGIAGHRCCRSNGQPFRYLDKLHTGDKVIVDTNTAQYIYKVVSMDSCRGKPQTVVNYKSSKVLWPTPCKDAKKGTRRLMTMTTCTPYGSERTPDRLVAWAELESVNLR
jgi:LPXTG-site transpeptidase (sortase) family protein